MAPHHEDGERHGAHPLQEYEPMPERAPFREHMDRMEVGENGGGFALTWANLKELAYVVSVILALAGAYYGIRGEIQDGRRDVEALAARVVIIERGRAENLPRLEEQIRNNAMQDQRIQNLTEALNSVRQMIVDLTRVVSSQSDLIHEAHERQAVLEERLGHVGPHDR